MVDLPMRSHIHRVIIVYRHRIRRHGSAYDKRSHCQSAERKNPLQCSGHGTPPFQHPGRRPRISRLPSLSSPARSLETRPASLHDAISHSHQASRFNAAILSNYAQHLLRSFISGRAEGTGYTLNGNVTLTEKTLASKFEASVLQCGTRFRRGLFPCWHQVDSPFVAIPFAPFSKFRKLNLAHIPNNTHVNCSIGVRKTVAQTAHLAQLESVAPE